MRGGGIHLYRHYDVIRERIFRCDVVFSYKGLKHKNNAERQKKIESCAKKLVTVLDTKCIATNIQTNDRMCVDGGGGGARGWKVG